MPVNGSIGGDRLAVLPVAIAFNPFALQQINFEKDVGARVRVWHSSVLMYQLRNR